MPRLLCALSSLALAISSASAATAETPAPPAAQQAMISPAGTYQLVVPERWEWRAAGTQTLLTSPEADISLWFDASDSADIAASVAAAWSAAGEIAPAAERITPVPPRPGFSAAQLFDYAPVGDTIRQALVATRNGRHFIVLIKGERAALDQRGAQVNIAITGFRPTDLPSDSLASAPTVRLDERHAAAMAAYVKESMERFDIPGAVVGIVQDGRLVMLEGFGARQRGAAAPITPDIPETSEREAIQAIQSRLAQGESDATFADFFVQLMERYRRRGCEAVVTACAELPLVITQDICAVPVIDPLDLQTLACAKFAMS